MIYTVTFNPAIDYVVHIDGELKNGMTNRAASEECYFGGKGINVSTVLGNLGIESTALGFIAGFTGDAIEKSVIEKGIKADFIRLSDGMSRINVKIKGSAETELNAQGPRISSKELESLFTKLDKLREGDMLILAGSIPASLQSDVYEQILERLQKRSAGIDAVVDATKDLLRNVLKYKPFLIKPNDFELGEMFDTTVESFEDAEKYARLLQKEGARNVLVSMGAKGALLVTELGECFRASAPKGQLKNSVGAGDSMVAGFIAGFLKEGSYKEALKMGVAAGSATAFTDDLATKEEIYKIYNFV